MPTPDLDTIEAALAQATPALYEDVHNISYPYRTAKWTASLTTPVSKGRIETLEEAEKAVRNNAEALLARCRDAERLEAALKIMAAQPDDAPDAIGVTPRNIARTVLRGAPGGVHNHDPEGERTGAGIECREYLIGACRLTPESAK